MILVIAANFQGYLYFIEQYGLDRKHTLYVNDIQKLRGYENRLVLLAPGWWMGHGGSAFEKSMSEAGLDLPDLRRYFNRLKFIEVL
jgi:hypothetical protein